MAQGTPTGGGLRPTLVTTQFLNDVERDRRSASSAVLERVEQALNLAPDFLNALAGRLPAWAAPVSMDEWRKVRELLRVVVTGASRAS
jgi:hypothetical protein